MDVAEIRAKLVRKASVMVVGGFSPPVDPLASWFGRVRVAHVGEVWPSHRGKPMLPLCQINCGELPHRPEALSDIAFITVFIARDELPADASGQGWALRTYATLNGLVEIKEPEPAGPIVALPAKWELCEEDYPCREDVGIELPPDVEAKYYDLFVNRDGSKVGGWPSLIQSEIFWAPGNKHPANPEYVFQIDSETKAHWAWGDAGVGYFGRGTGGARDQWALDWQCL
jgi:hypothetical protein